MQRTTINKQQLNSLNATTKNRHIASNTQPQTTNEQITIHNTHQQTANNQQRQTINNKLHTTRNNQTSNKQHTTHNNKQQ